MLQIESLIASLFAVAVHAQSRGAGQLTEKVSDAAVAMLRELPLSTDQATVLELISAQRVPIQGNVRPPN